MATVARVTRVANPRRGRGKVRAKRRNPRHRRRLTAKQIRYFGTKAQKAGLKRRKKHTKRTTAVVNPRRKRASVTRNPRRRRATRNPALVVTLGAVNPARRKTYMAKRKRKSNPRRRYAARRRNPVVRTVTRRRRLNVRHRRRSMRRRNPMPSFFGAAGARGLGTTIAGGLVGVAAAKLLPGLVPAGLIPITGIWPRVLITGVAAWGAGTAATKFVGKSFGDAVFFGGLMQTGSMVLNALLPNFKVGGIPLALSGLGELVPGQFPVPQNPLRISAPAPTQARVTMNGLTRAFGVAL